MARRSEHTVACPHCGAERATRAQQGVRLACTSCGEMFRCPAPEPAAEASAGVEPATTGQAAPAASPPAAGLPEGFEEATLDVRQNARPRSRGTDSPPAEPFVDDEPPADDDDWQQQLGPRADPKSIRPTGQRRAQRAGRKGGRSRERGGLGFYKGMTS